ncbi:MFS transporter, DHA2 family, metal-tetracycline-proton antiporter/MFS transporter, DHA2 family, florfenicol/chloramphenicol resistance protein [Saccharopolyspora antimicrobica]|uniref:DHA2 family metal-tetracycline-proton antiporter-like MFS transporter/DHA2 family florfenicol/chloramphenicol resistance protein-like MFS transporter n=1 Tax=Saccharopolyspora antimicrobica TaxID=455193 RepID=A0A1I5L810_9PSEU|nr:MFS transporter [Saccharopolyspora antimicrobica]RKT86861.1 DHA2 family metal-tetracycline-proton antiporter-like MFS transporter/DHA2 family florfenicol/chloramphenicol resistance protein-like MFS transporter [Saccharopolyspora antimicrobica]SFO93338.1 MFS transporter, DHA2 family, metal-tetracycline-proton antiporter/MFS transporter, DHA2 family, florfenicol/chloramphenicol resistance protein [Saccharopolyspora antimicrobica]
MTATIERTGSGVGLLAVLMPAVLVTVIASDMVNLMLPSIGAEFGAAEAELAWVVTGFLLVFAVGIPIYGRVSDRVGLRQLFGFALLAYAAGSLVCALAPDLLVLVLGRIAMGIGAAAIPVLSVIAITRLLPADRRGTAIGVVSAAAGVGTAAGPALGGGVGQFLGWRTLFWFMAGIVLVLLPAAWRALPGAAPAGGNKFDLLGGVLLGTGAGFLLFGATQAQVSGLAALPAWGSFLASAVAIALFGWRTVRAAQPFVPPSLFTNRVYRIAVVVTFLAMAVNLGGLVFVPLLLVDVNGLAPGTGALVMVPAGIAVAVLSPLIGRITDRIGTRLLVLAGLTIMALSAAFLAAAHSVLPTAAGILGLSVGFILVLTPIINAAAGALPPEQVGVGIGILQGAQFLGAGTGPALFGVLLAARQQQIGAEAAFSQVFLAMAVIVVLALIAASRMRPER